MQGKKAARAGILASQSDLCQYNYIRCVDNTNISHSRTYGDDTGEDIREGYEPTEDATVVEGDKFAVGEDEEQESEESHHWKQAKDSEVLLIPKYGLDGEDFENVWEGGEPSEPPRENP